MLVPVVSFLTTQQPALRRVGQFVAVALGLAAAGCRDKTEPAPEQGVDYYPVAVNNFWTYVVADSAYSQATNSQPTSTLQVSNYQFRETIVSAFADAAGQPAYRLVRAKRIPPATTWVDDSVFVLTPTPQSVALTRNNLKTLELIFPVREGRLWNFNAYNNNTADTITAETRRYSRVGQPFTTRAGAVQTYPLTLATSNEGLAKSDDSYYVKTYEQVYAKGVGPVMRRRRRYARFYTTDPRTGSVTFVPNAYIYGFSRTETLVDYGPK